MSDVCARLHQMCNRLPRHRFPFDATRIPQNGIYVLFEEGEKGHGCNRIVRIGTHTGDNQLRSRLIQHFLKPNKDRSIFRKNIGRCLLNRDQDPFLVEWQRDRTTRLAKTTLPFDAVRMTDVEKLVTERLQNTFSFVVLAVPQKSDRLQLESKFISTVSNCEICRPSTTWLGLSSPIDLIRKGGLWQVLELYKASFSDAELFQLETTVKSA